MGSALTVSHPSGPNSWCTRSAPPRAGSDGTSMRSGIDIAARSGIAAHTPRSALLKTVDMATDISDEAA